MRGLSIVALSAVVWASGCAGRSSVTPATPSTPNAITSPQAVTPDLADADSSRAIWLAPATLLAGSSAAVAIAHANGMSFGRIAGDSLGGALGSGIGVTAAALFYTFGPKSDDAFKAALLFPLIAFAGGLGGVVLGEVAAGHPALPKGTTGPAFGGFVVGAAFDIGGLIAIANVKGEHNAAAVMTAILAPIAIGTQTVAGYSFGPIKQPSM